VALQSWPTVVFQVAAKVQRCHNDRHHHAYQAIRCSAAEDRFPLSPPGVLRRHTTRRHSTPSSSAASFEPRLPCNLCARHTVQPAACRRLLSSPGQRRLDRSSSLAHCCVSVPTRLWISICDHHHHHLPPPSSSARHSVTQSCVPLDSARHAAAAAPYRTGRGVRRAASTLDRPPAAMNIKHNVI
jgi:hypothetical protein